MTDPIMFDVVASAFNRKIEHCKMTTGLRKALHMVADIGSRCGVAYLKEGMKVDRDSIGDDVRLIPYWQHSDWQCNWPDSTAAESDLSDARYHFEIYQHDLDTKCMQYPEHHKLLRDLSCGYTPRKSPDESLGYDSDIYGGGLFDLNRKTDANEGSEERRIVSIGVCWHFQNFLDKKSGRLVLVCCANEFATDPSFTRVHSLAPPKHLYMHNRIPVSQVCYARYTQDGMPYSPAVNDRRGINRAMTWMLRTMLTQASSNTIKVNMTNLHNAMASMASPDLSVKRVLQQYQEAARQQIKTFPEWGPPGSLEFGQERYDMQKQVELFSMPKGMSDATHNIDPSLLGQRTNIEAAVAMQAKLDTAHSALSSFFDSYDAGVAASHQRMLANIRQFGMSVHYGPIINENAELMVMEPEDFKTIAEHKAEFVAIPEAKDTTLIRDQLTLIMLVAEKLPAEMAAAYLPAVVRASGVPEGHRILRSMIELNAKMGITTASALVPDSMKKQVEQMESQNQQQQAQAAGQMQRKQHDKARLGQLDPGVLRPGERAVERLALHRETEHEEVERQEHRQRHAGEPVQQERPPGRSAPHSTAAMARAPSSSRTRPNRTMAISSPAPRQPHHSCSTARRPIGAWTAAASTNRP